MSSDIIEYKDYVFVRNIDQGGYDVELLRRQLASSVSLQDAYRISDDDWDRRYPISHDVDKRAEFYSELKTQLDIFEVTGTIIRNCSVVTPTVRYNVRAESFSMAQLQARMRASVEYGSDCLLRDVKVRRIKNE